VGRDNEPAERERPGREILEPEISARDKVFFHFTDNVLVDVDVHLVAHSLGHVRDVWHQRVEVLAEREGLVDARE